MEIRHRTEGLIDILEPHGRFDIYEVQSFVQWFEEHPAARYVVVNMKSIDFIDSTGLSMLVKGLKLCRKNDGELCLCEMQKSVQIIFEMTRLDIAFRAFGTEAAALADLLSTV